MKYIVALITVFVLLTGSPNPQDSSKTIIKYQVDSEYPPYSYANDGSLFGFDPYLTNIIFTSSEYLLEYSTDTWDKVLSPYRFR